MPQQHDLDLANQIGASFRADLNLALRAISAKQWGPSAPPTLVPYMDWVDSTTSSAPIAKIYDGASWLAMGTIDATNHLWQPVIGGGTDSIASAATTDLSTKAATGLDITGTTTITAFGTVPKGQIKRLRFAASLTLTYNATTMLLPGGRTIQTRAGDTCIAESLGAGNWLIYGYAPAAALPNAGLLTEAVIASAATTNLGAATSQIVSISGTTTITSFGSSANLDAPLYFVRFTGALTLTYNGTSMILPGGVSITTGAGDSALAQYLGSGNWVILSYNKSTGNLSGRVALSASTTATVAASAMTLSLLPCAIDFRTNTLTSGASVSRTVSTTISLVIPSTATLGCTNAVAARFYILAIDNAGTVELAVVNAAGGVNLNEEGVISTTAIAGASNSISTIYSTTARTNVAYRVIGIVDHTQATAGTYATTPSLVIPIGGNVGDTMSSLGYGQTRQTVSRTTGTTYYNTTGKPIFIEFLQISATSIQAIIGGISTTISTSGTAGDYNHSSYIILPGQAYSWILNIGTTPTIYETR